MPPVVDWGNVEEATGFEPIPEGIYPAMLVKATWNNDKQYYNAEFQITEGEFEGRKQWMTLSLKPGALPFTKRNLIRLGADATDLAPGSGVDTDDIVGSCYGNPCQLVVKLLPHTTKEGEYMNNVADLLPA